MLEKLSELTNDGMREKSHFKGKMKRLIIYLLASVVFFATCHICKLQLIEQVRTVNIFLGIIVIPCCVLYYKIYKKTYIYLYIMICLSLVSEYLIRELLYINQIQQSCAIFPNLVRLVLVVELIRNRDSNLDYKKYIKECALFIFIVNVASISFKTNIGTLYFGYTTEDIIRCIYLVVIFITNFVLLKQVIKAVKDNNFLDVVLNISIIILGVKVFLTKATFGQNHDLVNSVNGMMFFAAFLLIVVSLLIEFMYTIEENDVLNENIKVMHEEYELLQEFEMLREHFFANLSHEFKTPINVIFSSLQLLDLQYNNDKENFMDTYEKYNSVIKQNCNRTLRLVNNLVDITKLNSGFVELYYVNTDIVSLVEDITMSVVPYMESKNIDIVFDTMIEELIIACDVDAIERIILNLLSNSIKFSNENGKIFVNIDSDDDFVYISVKDNGIGIDEDKKNTVFNAFVQGDKSLTRKREGSGIGLSLVKSLVELHEGDVYFEDVDEGTEIIVKLPNKTKDTAPVKSVDCDRMQKILNKANVEFSDIYEIS